MGTKPKYQLSRNAKADLEAIWLYGFETWSMKQAETYAAGLYDCFDMIGDLPGIGRKAFHLRPQLLRFEHESHTIFYTVRRKQPFILRILHVRMDSERHL
jgi:toxin ParE1/3/4